MSFEALNLQPEILKAIESCGFDKPTDIQTQAVPIIMSGKDLMASAQTGTGKTAAFVLPSLQHLTTKPAGKGNGPRVLVLTPTRELALQVEENIRQLSRFCKLRSGTVVGGMPYPPQMRMLRAPLDLLVATPGRLMDHMESGRLDFSRLEILILDEADRMLDMGFVDAVRQIAKATPKARQTLLFSATLEGKVMTIAKELLKDPARVALAANHERHASITQSVFHADDMGHKHRLLAHHLSCDTLTQAVIFTSTKRNADKLASTLKEKGLASAPLHGDMGQHQRKRTVDQMRRGKVQLLVATDVAARGLDIKGISHVINFDLPMVAEDYIHRIGRTGRGGSTGKAISFVGPDDWAKLSGIERLTGSKLERSTVEGLEPRTSEPRNPRAAAPGRKRSNGGWRNNKASAAAPRGRNSNSRNGSSPGRNGNAGRPAQRRSA